MIFKLKLTVKEQARDVAFEADVVVDDIEEAEAAGGEFWRLAMAIAGGFDKAAKE